MIGEAHSLAGKLEAAKTAWQQALVRLEQGIKEKENYGRPYIYKSLTLAGLGDKDVGA